MSYGNSEKTVIAAPVGKKASQLKSPEGAFVLLYIVSLSLDRGDTSSSIGVGSTFQLIT